MFEGLFDHREGEIRLLEGITGCGLDLLDLFRPLERKAWIPSSLWPTLFGELFERNMPRGRSNMVEALRNESNPRSASVERQAKVAQETSLALPSPLLLRTKSPGTHSYWRLLALWKLKKVCPAVGNRPGPLLGSNIDPYEPLLTMGNSH